MQRALAPVAAMRAALAGKGEGLFGGWYDPETIFGISETLVMVERRVTGEVKPVP